MENLVVIAVWIAVVLTGLALLTVALFGIRSALNGKLRPMAVISIAIPAAVLVVLYFVFGDWAEAAIWTTLITAVLAIGALLLSGVRGVIG